MTTQFEERSAALLRRHDPLSAAPARDPLSCICIALADPVSRMSSTSSRWRIRCTSRLCRALTARRVCRAPTAWRRWRIAFAEFIRSEIGGICDVVGESFGGRLALWIAIRHPDLVNQMVLESPAGLRSYASGATPTAEQEKARPDPHRSVESA